MKVLYAIQATGNGHVARARALIPELKPYVSVDILLSGDQAELHLPWEVKYRFQGLGFYFGTNGGIDLIRTLRQNNFRRFIKEIRSLDLSEYDIIITDFEPVSAWAGLFQGKYVVGVGNQYALQSPWVAKPRSMDLLGKAIIRWYAPVNTIYPTHYNARHPSIFKPLIREEVRALEPENGESYLVYLPSYSDEKVISFLSRFPETPWVVFSKKTKIFYRAGNIEVYPISEKLFLKRLESCKGVLCNAGFSLTTEAIYLQKKLMVIPMRMQYEQQCNAFSLQQMGVPILGGLREKDIKTVSAWVQSAHYINLYYTGQTRVMVHTILQDYIKHSGSLLNSVQHQLMSKA